MKLFISLEELVLNIVFRGKKFSLSGSFDDILISLSFLSSLCFFLSFFLNTLSFHYFKFSASLMKQTFLFSKKKYIYIFMMALPRSSQTHNCVSFFIFPHLLFLLRYLKCQVTQKAIAERNY